MTQHKPEDYKHIYVWGRYTGSYMAYIRAQQELAAQEQAPIDAIYCNYDMSPIRWARVGEIVNPEKRKMIEDLAEELKKAD